MANVSGVRLTEQLIYQALDAVGNKNGKILNDILGRLDLNQLGVSSSDQLLQRFLLACQQNDAPEMALILLTQWRRIYPHEETIPIYALLPQIDTIDKQTLTFVMQKVYPNISVFKVIQEMIKNHSQHIAVACNRIFKTANPLTPDQIITLYHYARRAENAPVTNFLYLKVAEVMSYHEIPSWVKDFTSQGRTPVMTIGDINISDSIQITDQIDLQTLPTYIDSSFELDEPAPVDLSDSKLMELIEKYSTDPDYTSFIRKNLKLISSDERFSLIQQWLGVENMDKNRDDTLLFRLYGPSNPLIGEWSDSDASSRMFQSLVIFNGDDDNLDNQPLDWFGGYCEFCLRKIRRRWHAVRQPNESGGWTGCYCSWKCVSDGMATPETFDGLSDNSVVTKSLIKLFNDQLHTYGIQDRQDNGDILIDVNEGEYIEPDASLLALTRESSALVLVDRALTTPAY